MMSDIAPAELVPFSHSKVKRLHSVKSVHCQNRVVPLIIMVIIVVVIII